MEDREQQSFNKIIDDFEIYAEVNLKIKTKEGKIYPLEFNDPQKYIHAQLQKQLSETGKIRALLLKGRQQGASTYTEGRFYWRTSTGFGKQAYILTHEQAATDNLFIMAKRYHDNANDKLKPSVGASNAKELLFNKLDSGYKVGTAGSRAVGRSGTIQFFHGSEIAFWNNADEHFAGVLQCVPDGNDSDGTEVILESTANGVGGKFYDLWIEAIAGKNDYIAVFVPWFWSKEYRKSAIDFVPTPDELKKQVLYGVDNEQLAWRRSKITELGNDLCNQEYPYCWEEAFLSTGRTVFDKDAMAKALLECYNPIKCMVLENGKFVARKDGYLKVWSEPKAGMRYVVGADVAEGLIDGDYSTATVLDKQGYQVAQYHGHIAPDLFGKLLIALGNMYNSALLIPECNNHGLLTATVIRDSYYPYLYVQKSVDDGYTDSKEQTRVGWLTTRRTKPLIIDTLSAALRDGTHGICDKEVIKECQSYIINDDGSYGAQRKTHDDRVMSYAIAFFALRFI